MATESDLRGEELAAIVHEIRDRVRARYPQGEARGIGGPLPDLLPILHARDAAEAKVAAIGTVNPRPPGPLNAVIQFTKRNMARALGWFVRDQVEFNRSMLSSLQATLDALNEVNRALVAAGSRLDDVERGIRHDMAEGLRYASDKADALQAETAEIRDMRTHWIQWRNEWEKKLFQNEVHFLRSVSDLQAATDARLAGMDSAYRETVRLQHAEFTAELARTIGETHDRFWRELQTIRLEYERVIHNELRVVRQKAFASGSPSVASPVTTTHQTLDYARFADRFRGSEEYVRQRQQFYAPYFQGRSNVLDIGCGRGEFLELMKEAGVRARGVDLDQESAAVCRSKGLSVETSDVFDLLAREPDGSFDGIFAAQVIEHLPPEQVPQLVNLCAAKLKSGGILALETPNPECLAIFATHFYLDPTHTRPIPPQLLVFYYEEAGFGGIEVHRLSPAVESMPSLQELPETFRNAFFGGLDYGVIGRRL